VTARSSSDVFREIRTEVFRDTQTRFGKRLGLTRETVLRLERRKEGHRVSFKHLHWLRDVRGVPAEQAERMQALLTELETAIAEELRAEAAMPREDAEAGDPRAELVVAEQTFLSTQSEEAARRAEAAAQRAERLRLEEQARREEDVRRAEEAAGRAEQLRREEEARREEERREREETVRRSEAAVERMEQLRREEAAQREEADRKREEAVRRAEAAVQRAEQLRGEEEARREEAVRRAASEAEDAAEREKQARAAARRRARGLTFANLAASLVFGALAGWFVSELSRAPQDVRAGEQAVRNSDVAGVDAGSHWEQVPPQRVSSGGLDAGTEFAEMLSTALPIPKGGISGQVAAPCPEGIEEINGYCWVLTPLTSTQVKLGLCDHDGDLYEPSAGWCRAHSAAYRPYRGKKRKNNNVVDP